MQVPTHFYSNREKKAGSPKIKPETPEASLYPNNLY